MQNNLGAHASAKLEIISLRRFARILPRGDWDECRGSIVSPGGAHPIFLQCAEGGNAAFPVKRLGAGQEVACQNPLREW